MEVLSIDFHTSITNTILVYGKSNSTTPYAPFVQTTFLNYFKSYYSMTWHLCAILLLISYTGNLESLQFTFGKSNLSMTLHTNNSSNSLYLWIEVWQILYINMEFISHVLSNTVNKTKLINYYKIENIKYGISQWLIKPSFNLHITQLKQFWYPMKTFLSCSRSLAKLHNQNPFKHRQPLIF